MYALRFDMRAPDLGAAPVDLYAAAIEMSAWAERHGALAVGVCEHHASPDGYLPSPLVLAAAIAARTTTIPIRVVALLAPLHDPVKVAEDMAVLDLISRGRVGYVVGLGYRQEEYDLFGVAKAERGARLDAAVATIQAAFRGEPLPGRDPALRVTPAPFTPGGPSIQLGGGTPAAAKRAARLGLGMITETSGVRDAYLAACAERGVEPGFFVEAPPNAVTTAFVDDDPDALWARVGPHLLHDARTYSAWNATAGKAVFASVEGATTVDELRAVGHPYRVFTPDEAVAHIRATGPLNIAPLCGGAPPEIGWSTLDAVVDRVLPQLASPTGE